MIYGVLALAAGLPAGVAVGMSSIVFAGSAQFVGTQLIGAAAPWVVILLTTLIINLRHLLYSASVAPHVKHLSPAWKWLLAYLLTDEAYAVTILHYARADLPLAHKHWYFLSAGVLLWTTWQASTVAGVYLGTQVPAGWSLDFTLALTFLGLLIPALKQRAEVAAALAAGLVAVAAADLPYKLGLVLAVLVGLGVGFALDRGVPAPPETRMATPPQGPGGDA